MKRRPYPTVLIMDEIYRQGSPSLMSWLAIQRESGFMIIGLTQSVQQLFDLFGPPGKDISAWRTIVMHRGILDPETRELASGVAGEFDKPMRGSSESRTQAGRIEDLFNESTQKRRRLDPDAIARGHVSWPHGALVIRPNAAVQWINAVPYYSSAGPWPRIMINSLEHAYAAGQFFPPPNLAKEGDYRHLTGDLKVRFIALQNKYNEQKGKN